MKKTIVGIALLAFTLLGMASDGQAVKRDPLRSAFPPAPLLLLTQRDVGQCMGACASEQGICISQCQGNGQCIGQCAAAHGRCVSRCN